MKQVKLFQNVGDDHLPVQQVNLSDVIARVHLSSVRTLPGDQLMYLHAYIYGPYFVRRPTDKISCPTHLPIHFLFLGDRNPEH